MILWLLVAAVWGAAIMLNVMGRMAIDVAQERGTVVK
jgi:hypothetical protein